MKLLFCISCQDIIRLLPEEKQCVCGKTKGKALDNINCVYSGEYAIPIGISNTSLVHAIKGQPQYGMGKEFTAFVIPKNCSTIKKEM